MRHPSAAAPWFDSRAGPAMYTNALLGSAYDTRHVWRPAAKNRLEDAVDSDVYAKVPCECGEVAAYHEPDEDGQQHMRLVPVRDLGVDTLADFLIHPGTDEPCARCAASTLGLEWPPERASVPVEDIQDPEYVSEEYHQDGVQHVRDQMYGRTTYSLDDLAINSYGTPMHIFPGRSTEAICGQVLKDIDLPNSTPAHQQNTWPASEGWDSRDELMEQFSTTGNASYCSDCGECLEVDDDKEVVVDVSTETDTTTPPEDDTPLLRIEGGLPSDQQGVVASFHEGGWVVTNKRDTPVTATLLTCNNLGEQKVVAKSEVQPHSVEHLKPPSSVGYASFVEYGRNDQHGPARVVDTDLSVGSDLKQAGRQALEQGQVEHEFSIEVDGEDAWRLTEWLRDRAAGDSR